MVFLIRDSFILTVGTKYDNEDIIKVFRDEVGRILSTSCIVYIDDQPINDALPKTFPEKVDALVYYLLQGTTVFKFKWHGDTSSESVIHLQTYSI